LAEDAHPEFSAERERVYLAVGKAISQWSKLEHAFASAFALCLGAEQEVANSVFFSARSFGGKIDMLSAALNARAYVSSDSAKQMEVLRAACKKAAIWSAARNKLAHDRTAVYALGEQLIVGGLAPNAVLGNEMEPWLQKSMTRVAIDEVGTRFHALAEMINIACSMNDTSFLEEMLERVRALPHIPYTDTLESRITGGDQPNPELLD